MKTIDMKDDDFRQFAKSKLISYLKKSYNEEDSVKIANWLDDNFILKSEVINEYDEQLVRFYYVLSENSSNKIYIDSNIDKILNKNNIKNCL